MAMMAITTSNSIKVNPFRAAGRLRQVLNEQDDNFINGSSIRHNIQTCAANFKSWINFSQGLIHRHFNFIKTNAESRSKDLIPRPLIRPGTLMPGRILFGSVIQSD
jgi:hypothetical protein